MMGGEDVKPDVKDEKVEHINVKVVGQGGQSIHFKIKKSTPLKKLMEAYCDKVGTTMTRVRFFLDDNRLSAEETAEQVGLEDEDQITVRQEQVGGSL